MSPGSRNGKEGSIAEMPLPDPQEQEIEEFWRRCQEDMEKIVDFEEHVLPVEFLENVIHTKHDNMRMPLDTAAFLSKTCELFVQELSVRALKCAMSHGRRIILDSDIIHAVDSTNSYKFLNDVLHKHEEHMGAIMENASTSNTAPQLLQERFSLMAIVPSGATSSVGIEAGMSNNPTADVNLHQSINAQHDAEEAINDNI